MKRRLLKESSLHVVAVHDFVVHKIIPSVLKAVHVPKRVIRVREVSPLVKLALEGELSVAKLAQALLNIALHYHLAHHRLALVHELTDEHKRDLLAHLERGLL